MNIRSFGVEGCEKGAAVQLRRRKTLRGIKILSPIQHQYFIGNKQDRTIVDGMQRLRNLSAETRRLHEGWGSESVET